MDTEERLSQDAVRDSGEEHFVEPVDPLERLLEIVSGKEETLEKVLNLLQEADHKGILRLIGYFVEESNQLVDAGIDTLTTANAFSLMSSASEVKHAISQIDFKPLPTVLKGISQFMEGLSAQDQEIQVRGAFDLVKLLKDPDIRTALTAIFSGLKSLGKGMRGTV
ncbi:DUF1641 domain-containing protein [Alicyclobacillus sp. ALC3]|uniref:DUF1641 domain-containing protein n=1 Tax=Alicyclobacillus sp. ALC3 TaxID=2796143 RepID=UPI0023795F45|nr:DUF1641 domain-containing protein [Alicyclobacillus sp. ALC3]WDL98187.1 DUF1641 domain-containing protein [Alicyclobacillus sp. ALC3]